MTSIVGPASNHRDGMFPLHDLKKELINQSYSLIVAARCLRIFTINVAVPRIAGTILCWYLLLKSTVVERTVGVLDEI